MWKCEIKKNTKHFASAADNWKKKTLWFIETKTYIEILQWNGRKKVQTHLKRQISNFFLNLSPCCILADVF